jgi:hypothetical protein
MATACRRPLKCRLWAVAQLGELQEDVKDIKREMSKRRVESSSSRTP